MYLPLQFHSHGVPGPRLLSSLSNQDHDLPACEVVPSLSELGGEGSGVCGTGERIRYLQGSPFSVLSPH
jgi:hypothetical protein